MARRAFYVSFAIIYLLGMVLLIDTYRELERQGFSISPAAWVVVTVAWPLPVAYSLARYGYRSAEKWWLARQWQALRDEVDAITERCNANPERCP